MELMNCILMLSLYQRSFPFIGIVFSDSEAVKDFATANNVLTVSNVARNKYGLPIITSLYERAYNIVNGSFYGYINSDIILNSHIFSLLHNVTNLIDQGKLSPLLELAARVYMRKPFLKPDHFSSITTFTRMIDSLNGGVPRNMDSAVLIIWCLFIRIFSFLQERSLCIRFLRAW